MKYVANPENGGREACVKKCADLPVRSELAVPITNKYYKCMQQSAGGHRVPFWTGLEIAEDNTLIGSMNGRQYRDLPVFGAYPTAGNEHPRIASIFWNKWLGTKDSAKYVYLDDRYFVAAKKDLQQFPIIGCMCQEPSKQVMKLIEVVVR